MHYYGYKLDEALKLKVTDYNTLVRAMDINQARDALKEMEWSVYPKLKQDNRKELHRNYYRVAHPHNFEHKNVVKLSDIAKVLNGR